MPSRDSCWRTRWVDTDYPPRAERRPSRGSEAVSHASNRCSQPVERRDRGRITSSRPQRSAARSTEREEPPSPGARAKAGSLPRSSAAPESEQSGVPSGFVEGCSPALAFLMPAKFPFADAQPVYNGLSSVTDPTWVATAGRSHLQQHRAVIRVSSRALVDGICDEDPQRFRVADLPSPSRGNVPCPNWIQHEMCAT